MSVGGDVRIVTGELWAGLRREVTGSRVGIKIGDLIVVRFRTDIVFDPKARGVNGLECLNLQLFPPMRHFFPILGNNIPIISSYQIQVVSAAVLPV
jgi:hypothetical protein